MVTGECLYQSVENLVGKTFFHEFHSCQLLNIFIRNVNIQGLISSIRTVFNFHECKMVVIKRWIFHFIENSKTGDFGRVLGKTGRMYL